jgi:hypothetical protein
MRTRKEVKAELIEAITWYLTATPPFSDIKYLDKAIDLWLELKDAPADDKVNANCYTCGNVIRVTKETRAELQRAAGVFICEECYERGKLATEKPQEDKS